MNKWYRAIVLNEDISKINDCMDYFEDELKEARTECKIKGSLEQAAARLPGIFEHRYSQLQEVESILEYLNIELRRIRSKHFRIYKETYNTELADRIIDKYVDGEDDIVAWSKILNSIALIRNQYISITKSLDQKNWLIGHIVRLRTAGIEDATI